MTLQTLSDIRKLGIKIALDDFGSGYATFQYFQTFDLDILKIDSSFIQNLFTGDEKSTTVLAIVSAFLHFAKTLGIEVTAEGVEDLEQLKFLAQKECDVIQGYIYSKPLPNEEFEKVLQKKHLKPIEQSKPRKPGKEKRRYFRFQFPRHLPVRIFTTKIRKNKLNVGYATGLIKNISLGGIRLLSSIRLPVISELDYQFEFEIMGKKFTRNGSLVYKNKEKQNILLTPFVFNW